jgi:2-keto-4-pentenoate hydratase/2-oxohepta-3-ene-1,7-dioic acid hydratase in catechol pathway
MRLVNYLAGSDLSFGRNISIILAFLSAGLTLEPGPITATGTASGVGSLPTAIRANVA